MFNKDKKTNIKELFIKYQNNLSITKISIKLDWLIIFSLWVIVFLALILFSVYFYKAVFDNSRVASNNTEIKSSVNLDTEKLDRVVSDFNRKQEKFNSL